MVKEIQLTQGKKALVDEEDFPYLSSFKWYLKGDYAARDVRVHGKKVSLFMHKVIHPVEDGFMVDHKNGDALDNRKSNLRKATFTQNNINTRPRKDNKSGYRGVWYVTRDKKWATRIKVNKKSVSLGHYDNPHDAARMYNFWAADVYGEFARLNVINEEAN